jgi:hypothetical protein
MSKQSRSRLMYRIAEANRDPKWFVTLTYGADYPTARQSKEDLRIWSQRVLRLTARAGLRVVMVWRVEKQERGAPHFHLLVWCVGSSRASLVRRLPASSRSTARRISVRRLQRRQGSQRGAERSWWEWLAMLSVLWSERLDSQGRGSPAVLHRGVDLERIRSRRQVVAYVSKYVAKADPHEWADPSTGEIPATGRVWGVRGDRGILDARSLVRLTCARDGDVDGEIEDVWHESAMPWAANAERLGYVTYRAFVPADGLWGVVDRLFRVFCARPSPRPRIRPPRPRRSHPLDMSAVVG